MPAHVSLIVPFAPARVIDDDVKKSLRVLFERFARFEFVLREPGWFDRRVLFLSPEPSEPFRDMTRALVRAYPDYPPYEGAFNDIVPHVTIGEGGRLRRRRCQLTLGAWRLRRMAPVTAVATEVWLMELDARTKRWRRLETFSLGGCVEVHTGEPPDNVGAGVPVCGADGAP